MASLGFLLIVLCSKARTAVAMLSGWRTGPWTPVWAKTFFFATPSSAFDLDFKSRRAFSMGNAVQTESLPTTHLGKRQVKWISRLNFCIIPDCWSRHQEREAVQQLGISIWYGLTYLTLCRRMLWRSLAGSWFMETCSGHHDITCCSVPWLEPAFSSSVLPHFL